MTDSIKEDEKVIAGRLEELGVSTASDQVEELASAYPALQAWIRIAEDLARDEPT